ncbi:hypothetical protein GALMADRAFT_1135211 [Galerina marginata CBS 339.88]|uniref:Uncharacterized protein n=1 Tax=Galerina marginata (strain CBS 339.88) TaxID=685588 RepID=A0A067S7P3_GALM3|nr:hypothetical protein GALMADRAFT_1135211 [Galerina marginata CBS 339.88]
MAVTAMILGLQSNPKISFHDGLVVIYLLYLAWLTVCFSLSSVSRFSKGVKFLKALSILQSCSIFAFTLAILITYKDFGSAPQCNANACLVLFRPFPAVKLVGVRILCWIITCTIFAIYLSVTLKDYFPSRTRMVEGWIRKTIPRQADDDHEGRNAEGGRNPNTYEAGKKTSLLEMQKQAYELPIGWDLVLKLAAILVSWALVVTNTELLIRWNHFNTSTSGASPPWQFGQILPMFLVVLPLVNVVNTFQEFGLRPWQVRRCDCDH